MVVGSALIVAGTIGAVASGPFAVFSFSTEQLCALLSGPYNSPVAPLCLPPHVAPLYLPYISPPFPLQVRLLALPHVARLSRCRVAALDSDAGTQIQTQTQVRIRPTSPLAYWYHGYTVHTKSHAPHSLRTTMLQVFWQAQTRRVRAGGRAYGPPVLMPILYAVSSALV